MRRRKEFPVIEKVRITDIGSEGNAIGKVDNQVLFVPMLIPGDIVDVRITRKRKNFMEGKVISFHEYSKDRIEPRCMHFGYCGGCKWQHLPYKQQLFYKEKVVSDNLKRIGKVDLPFISPILGSPDEFLYRNKLEYTFSSRRWMTHDEIRTGEPVRQENALGFHVTGLFDKVLDIKQCYLQAEPTNLIRNAVREFAVKKDLQFYDFREHKGFLRNLVIRTTTGGEVMVIVVFQHDDDKNIKSMLDFIIEKFPVIASLMFVINPKKNDSISDLDVHPYYGKDHLTESIDGLNFRIGPKSFFQTNSRQAANLYKVVRDFASLRGDETVYDLYTGTGTIACYLAGNAGKVIGIESIEDAVNDARVNSDLNDISNTLFACGDIKDLLNDKFFDVHGKPDVIITDPPRSGMHPDVVKAITDSSAAKVVYVSCNPSTQARDLNLMSEKYMVSRIQPVDMFPHTHHVENVVLLESRPEGQS